MAREMTKSLAKGFLIGLVIFVAGFVVFYLSTFCDVGVLCNSIWVVGLVVVFVGILVMVFQVVLLVLCFLGVLRFDDKYTGWRRIFRRRKGVVLIEETKIVSKRK